MNVVFDIFSKETRVSTPDNRAKMMQAAEMYQIFMYLFIYFNVSTSLI